MGLATIDHPFNWIYNRFHGYYHHQVQGSATQARRNTGIVSRTGRTVEPIPKNGEHTASSISPARGPTASEQHIKATGYGRHCIKQPLVDQHGFELSDVIPTA